MRGLTFISYTEDFRDNLYTYFHKVGNQTKAGLFAIPVAFVDTVVDVMRTPLIVIEQIAIAAINLLGSCCFCEGCSLGDTLVSVESVLMHASGFPATLVIAPLKFLYQSYTNVLCPTKAHSLNSYKTDVWGKEYVIREYLGGWIKVMV